jgi:hypothetical protein
LVGVRAKTAVEYLRRTPLRLDTRGIIASLLLGIAADLVGQIAERTDTALFAGTAVPFGYVNASIWMTVTCMIFGPVGGIIEGVVQASLSLLTDTSPLAPYFIPWNIVMAAMTGLFCLAIQPIRPGKSGILRQIAAGEFMNFATTPIWSINLLIFLLGAPFYAWLSAYIFYVGVGAIPIPLISVLITRAIIRSRALG